MTGEIQYIADSMLIEKIAKLDIAISKEASISSEIFAGVGSAVNSFVKSNIDTSSTGALIKSVLKLLEPGMFFKIHPILGMISTAASVFGFSVTDILSNIVSSVAPKLMAGESISPDEINQMGASLGAVTAFQDLHELEKNGSLLKTAQKTQPLGGSTFVPPKGTSLLHRLFGFLAQKKSKGSKGLVVGFIIWFIKTILLSAGLLSVGGATKNLVLGDDAEKEKSDTVEHTAETALVPTSAGQDYHPNNDENAWYVPLVNKSIPDTLLSWTTEIYPNLAGYEDIILTSSSFKRVLDSFLKEYENGKDFVLVPSNFHKRIDVVNQYIKEVQSLIKNAPADVKA